ncbi:SirB2 family protein [Psychrosphaera algicola]|uniref:SirB2 family protein n=1 Tax=Psychrosphaera algicola TaxID=3023714 RepID=A0ABT5F9H5_9GAMM|nr:SirB2 family protein [Psychrosphaera sp. G1-22]MDC2888177.1 SirB2 family protein [Psychrosphaera sp. G1-22]
MYFAVKHSHLSFCAAKRSIFYYRFYRFKIQNRPKTRFLAIAPHIIDTFLLISAVAMCFVIEQYPIQTDWLTAKVLFVIGYIGFAIVAIKSAKPAKSYSFLAAATVCLLFAGKIAATKSVF